MNEHGNAGPIANVVGIVLGFITAILDFLGNNAAGITCMFMIISVVGGLYLSWDRNQILKSQQKSEGK